MDPSDLERRLAALKQNDRPSVGSSSMSLHDRVAQLKGGPKPAAYPEMQSRYDALVGVAPSESSSTPASAEIRVPLGSTAGSVVAPAVHASPAKPAPLPEDELFQQLYEEAMLGQRRVPARPSAAPVWFPTSCGLPVSADPTRALHEGDPEDELFEQLYAEAQQLKREANAAIMGYGTKDKHAPEPSSDSEEIARVMAEALAAAELSYLPDPPKPPALAADTSHHHSRKKGQKEGKVRRRAPTKKKHSDSESDELSDESSLMSSSDYDSDDY